MLPSVKLEYVCYFSAVILAINLTVCSASLGARGEYHHLEHDSETPADCPTMNNDCDDSSTVAYFCGRMYEDDIDSARSQDIMDGENESHAKPKRSMIGLLGLATKRPQHHKMVGDLNFPVPKANFMPVRGKKMPFESGEYFGNNHH